MQRLWAGCVVVLMCVMLATGCYHFRAQAPQVTGKTEPKRDTVWSLAWGLAQEVPPIDNCQGQPLAEVHMSTNLGFALITVLTLGFASPQIVEWRCAGAQPSPGHIEIPSTSPRK